MEATKTQGEKGKVSRGRPHHRTTMLTVDAKTYEAVRNLVAGENLTIAFVNDIVSSAKGGDSVIHHALRRSDLLNRQIMGGYTRCKVRTDMERSANCLIVGGLSGSADACACELTVARDFSRPDENIRKEEYDVAE